MRFTRDHYGHPQYQCPCCGDLGDSTEGCGPDPADNYPDDICEDCRQQRARVIAVFCENECEPFEDGVPAEIMAG